MYRQLLKNALFSGMGQLATIISALVLTPIIISKLGDERFGIWTLIALVTSYIGFLDFGVSSAYSKYVSEYHARGELDKVNEVIVCGIASYLAISVMVLGSGLVLVRILPALFHITSALETEALSAFRIGLIVFSVASTFSAFEAVPVGLQRMEYNNGVLCVTTGLFIVAGVAYLHTGGDLVGLILIRGATTAVQIVLMYIAARRLLPTLTLSPKFLKWSRIKQLVVFGLKMQAARLAELGNFNVNRVLIGSVAGLPGVASYQIGFTFVQGVRQVTMLTFSGMTPMASHLAAQERYRDLVDLYLGGQRVSLVLTAAGFGLISAIADPAIILWTGKHYPLAATTLIILALANYVHVSTGTGTALARGMGKPELETLFGVALLLGNLVLGLALSRIWGFDGVLRGSLIAYVASSLFFVYLFNRLVKLSNVVYLRTMLLAPTAAMLLGLLAAWSLTQLWPLASRAGTTLNRMDALIGVAAAGSAFILAYSVVLVLAGYVRGSHLRTLVRSIRSPQPYIVPSNLTLKQ